VTLVNGGPKGGFFNITLAEFQAHFNSLEYAMIRPGYKVSPQRLSVAASGMISKYSFTMEGSSPFHVQLSVPNSKVKCSDWSDMNVELIITPQFGEFKQVIKTVSAVQKKWRLITVGTMDKEMPGGSGDYLVEVRFLLPKGSSASVDELVLNVYANEHITLANVDVESLELSLPQSVRPASCPFGLRLSELNNVLDLAAGSDPQFRANITSVVDDGKTLRKIRSNKIGDWSGLGDIGKDQMWLSCPV